MSRYIIRENEGTEVSNNPRIFDISSIPDPSEA